MNRRKLLTYSSITAFIWISGCTKENKTTSQTSVSGKQDVVQGYWTCTMHPQVHQDGPGKCPICGMPLVHVSGHGKVEKMEPEVIEATNSELQNAQVSKYTVTRQDLEIAIPVSGRLLGSRDVAFQIYESDLGAIKSGSEFIGSPTGSPGQVYKGRITSVDNLVDPSSRTIRVTGKLQESTSGLSTESSFHGEIRNTFKNQIVVPEESVLHSGTRELVFVFSAEHKLEPRAVQLGVKGKTGYQIISGLKEGEIISSGPNFLIDSEAKLRGQ